MKKIRLMGIVNATPDSFYCASIDSEGAIQRGLALYSAGADILDVGGESSRPHADPVPLEEELRRVIPVIQSLRRQVPIPISIDTMKAETAERALEAGASFINDITGFSDPQMRRLAASSGAEICVMHMQGTPKTMQHNPHYPEGIIPHLVEWFTRRVDLLLSEGVKEQQIVLDPGIGFGKTVAHNLEIIHNLHKLRNLGFPVLLGVSRKSFMAKILNKPSSELLPATLAMNVAGLLHGADIVRVHDVKEHRDAINLLECLKTLHA